MADLKIIDTGAGGWKYINQDPKSAIIPAKNSSTVAYSVYVDNSDDLKWRKITALNGTPSVGSIQNILTGTVTCLGVWADWWTPGNTGTKIHFCYIESVTGDVFYNYLDTSNDTVGSPVTVVALSTSAGNCSVTVAMSGNILVAYAGNTGAINGFYRSTNGGTSFTSRTTVNEGDNLDSARLFPAPLADPSDIWAIYYDWSASQLSLKTYDDSANTWSENIIASSVTQTTNHDMYGAAVRPSDGHLIVAVNTGGLDNAAADLNTFDIASGASITAKTDVITNADDWAAPGVFVAPNGDIYVPYMGKSDGTETYRSSTKQYYKKSTDGMTTWAAEHAYSETLRNQQYSFCPPTGYRFMAAAMADDGFFQYSVYTNVVNSVDVTPSSAPPKSGFFLLM